MGVGSRMGMAVFPYHTNELDKLQPNSNLNSILEVIDRSDYFVVACE